MELWTEELEQKTINFQLYSQKNKGKQSKVLVKYFNPYGAGTWIITEAEKQENGDWLFFGYCYIHEWEWGYALLSELQATKVNVYGLKLGLERDLYIPDNATVADLVQEN